MLYDIAKLFIKKKFLGVVSICAIFLFVTDVISQQSNTIDTPRGIIFGNDWNHETRELNIVFDEQDTLIIGEGGEREIQIWVEIKNNKGNNIAWVIEYSGGLRQEVLTQQIRYDRFRTYLSKTFRRFIWDTESKQNKDVTGPCKVILIDTDNNDRVISEKNFILK